MVLKSTNFIVSLICTILKYRIIITFLSWKFEYERLFENCLSVDKSFMQISYQNNIFNKDFNNFNAFLAIFNSSLDFKVCSKAPLKGFYDILNVNVTFVSNKNSTSRETILHNFLQQWIDLNIFRAMKPERRSQVALFETNSQILLSFIFFFYVFLKHKRNMRLIDLLILFIFLVVYFWYRGVYRYESNVNIF